MFDNKFNTDGRYIVMSGSNDLYIRNVRTDDAVKRFSCVTINSLTGERKISETVLLTIKGDRDK